MASVSLPPPRATVLPQSFNPADHSFSAQSRRRSPRMSTPLANPPFAFPARDPGDTSAPNPPDQPQPRTPPPLPAFSFNPGEGHTPQPSTAAPPSRGCGHRRQYSEFVGGDHLLSPEAAEDAHPNDEKPAPNPGKLPPPSPTFAKGGHGRRGHAHRRSGAVSSVDLSAVSKPQDTKPSSESAPGTPAYTNWESQHNEAARPMATSLKRPTSPASPIVPAAGSSPVHAEQKLDNGSSLATGQPCTPATHQVDESISDQVGSTARESNPSHGSNPESTTNTRPRTRPKTADASLSFDRSETGLPDNVKPGRRPISSAGLSRANKSMSSGALLDLAWRKMRPTGDDFHVPHSNNSSDAESSDASGDDADVSCEPSPAAKGKAKSKKKGKGQKKVRSWAGAILTRSKGKRPKKDASDSGPPKPPPVITRTNSDLGSGLDVDFDDDNVVVLRTPTNPNAPEPSEPGDTPTTPTLENSWKPRSFYEQGKQDDTRSPIIDLDAALGPFNTPEMRPGFVAGSNFSAATKHMYSGGRRGEFIGPEMRYHRRAESAPEMPPFDIAFMSGNRLAVNTAMENADVFYEEEEDAFLAASGQAPEDGGRPPSSPSGVVHADSSDNKSVKSTNSSKTLTLHTAGRDKESQTTGLGIRRNASAELSSDLVSPSQEDHVALGTPSAVEQVQQANSPFNQPKSPGDMVNQEKGQNKAPTPSSPDVSPGFLPADKRPFTSPLELGPNVSHLSLQNGRSLPDSSYASLDFNSASDVPHSIATPPATDRNLSRPSFNTPVDQSHASVEDVPSLTSSASTVTTRMRRLSATFFPHTRLSGDRSASFSAVAARRSSQANAAKRSSFASLSKLMVGSHGERSNLSHEEKPPGDTSAEAKKTGRRISRLVHFWRAKDKTQVE